MKKKKQKIRIKLDTTQLLINSAGKMSRSMDVVKTGTGAHKSAKDYDRKREKQSLRKEWGSGTHFCTCYPTTSAKVST